MRKVLVVLATLVTVIIFATMPARAYEKNDDWPTSGYCPGGHKMVQNVATDCNKAKRQGAAAAHSGAGQIQGSH